MAGSDDQEERNRIKNKRFKKLQAVSKESVDGNITHIVIRVDKDSGDITNGLQSDSHLNQLFKANIQNSLSAIETDQFCTTVTFPRLPFSPSSKQWKGSSLLRGILCKVLMAAGFSSAGKIFLSWPQIYHVWGFISQLIHHRKYVRSYPLLPLKR